MTKSFKEALAEKPISKRLCLEFLQQWRTPATQFAFFNHGHFNAAFMNPIIANIISTLVPKMSD
jgi:hypothetical protein